LAKLSAETMPQDDPGSLSAEETNKVASYVYEAFYSKAAQDRNKLPRVELARLTVRQYRNAVADLVGSFRAPARLDGQRGLTGQSFTPPPFPAPARPSPRAAPT